MKANTTYIVAEKFFDLAKQNGWDVKEQAGFIKISKAGQKVIYYVAKTKMVGRVDISQALVPAGDLSVAKKQADAVPAEVDVIDLGGNSFGKVHQQINFNRPETEILRIWSWLLQNSDKLQPLPAVQRQSPAALKGSKAKKSTGDGSTQSVEVRSDKTVTELVDELVRRRKLIKDTSEQSQTPVSASVYEKIDAKLQGLFAQATDEERKALLEKYGDQARSWANTVSSGPGNITEPPTPTETTPAA